MLAFFDFYPIISQHDHFFDLFQDALFWLSFKWWNYSLFLGIAIFSRSFVKLVSVKTVSLSILLSFLILGSWFTLEFIVRDMLQLPSLFGRLSDYYYYLTECTLLLLLLHIPYLFGYVLFRKKNSTFVSPPSFIIQFRNAPQLLQTSFVSSFWLILLSFPFILFPLSLIFFVLLFRRINARAATQVNFGTDKPSDLLPLLFLLITLFGISPIPISDIACNLPFVNGYFHCR